MAGQKACGPIRCIDAHRAGRPAGAKAVNRAHGFFKVDQRRAQPIKKLFARLGQRNTARGAMKQTDIKIAFHVA